jgi:hypothetical protein
VDSFKRRVGKPQKHTKKNSTSFKKGIDKPLKRYYNKNKIREEQSQLEQRG